jgi:hypothetical protein
MAPRWLAVAVLLAALGCGSSGGSTAEPPSTGEACQVDADCAPSNACSDAGCVGGYCQYAYLDATAVAILSGDPVGALLQLPIPTVHYAGTGYDATACPTGQDATASPPICILEADFGAGNVTFDALGGYSYRIGGTVPLRAQRIPVTGTVLGSPFSGDLTLTGNGACPGAVQSFAPATLSIDFSEEPLHGQTLTVAATVDAVALGDAVTACGSDVLASLVTTLRPIVAPALASGAEAQLIAALEPQLCLTPPCPTWAVDDGGICRVSVGGACAARGIDPGTGLLIIPACGA